MTYFILLAMIFMHIVDDYCLQQGCLASLKQRSWWEKNAPDYLYKDDYLVALAMHSMSWSFMVLLPIAIFYGFNVDWLFFVVFAINAVIHGVVDDLKANKRKINLCADQSFHMVQIFITARILLF